MAGGIKNLAIIEQINTLPLTFIAIKQSLPLFFLPDHAGILPESATLT
jgi:hypothetical protein